MLTFVGLQSKKKVLMSKGNLTTVLSAQRHRLISFFGHRSITAFSSRGLVSLASVGFFLQ